MLILFIILLIAFFVGVSDPFVRGCAIVVLVCVGGLAVIDALKDPLGRLGGGSFGSRSGGPRGAGGAGGSSGSGFKGGEDERSDDGYTVDELIEFDMMDEDDDEF